MGAAFESTSSQTDNVPASCSQVGCVLLSIECLHDIADAAEYSVSQGLVSQLGVQHGYELACCTKLKLESCGNSGHLVSNLCQQSHQSILFNTELMSQIFVRLADQCLLPHDLGAKFLREQKAWELKRPHCRSDVSFIRRMKQVQYLGGPRVVGPHRTPMAAGLGLESVRVGVGASVGHAVSAGTRPGGLESLPSWDDSNNDAVQKARGPSRHRTVSWYQHSKWFRIADKSVLSHIIRTHVCILRERTAR